MSSFRDKLARLGGAGPGAGVTEAREAEAAEPVGKSARLARARGLVEQLGRRRMGAGALLASRLSTVEAPAPVASGVLPGAAEETPHGPVHTVRSWLQPADCHGHVPVARALEADAALLAELALDPSLEGLDVRRMLLIDTETTGLSTAAGTVAFLIGVAFFEDESLCVEQYVLTELGRERPILERLAERIATASMVVSYNGKSFDWPLLRTRFVLNRVPTPPLPPHLDLLHCARRVFKKRLERVRLIDMERELLGFVREHDVSGAEIPGIYLRFLRSRDPGRLDAVIEHNGHDLVALAAIAGELTRRFRDVQREDDPRDHLAFARIAERAGDPERARAFAQAAARGGGDARCTVDAWMTLARVARRGARSHEEAMALHSALERAPAEARPRVHLELSKYYERRARRPALALRHAMQTAPAEDPSAQDRRIARLCARLARHNRRRGRRPRFKR